ncbi:spore coat protein [Acidaminobacter sp. JC074]|uniref:CotH kinase family protein n=1 Tax=Acidaminobacter sp. JC074 TaxID=2530199 RepID=UPI001F100B96|nr:CotH kinase family protein [Acidaminobacter sp. JC074]MCH4890426.1 spore coat protein [Acidaminobacter sp. JC074]
MLKKIFIIGLAIMLALVTVSCDDSTATNNLTNNNILVSDDELESGEQISSVGELATDEQSSKDTQADYDRVFNQDKVNEIIITIDPEQWALMQEDLSENIQSTRQNGPSAIDSTSDYTPVWAEASISFDDVIWEHVGISYKGNSSLSSTYSNQIGKLSFKLDFDEFEDLYPEIEDQRFYGFKQLNLNNNFSDTSLMREKVAADLFREFGVTAAMTSFYAVYVDYGEGQQYFGLYTLVEEMDDTGIEGQFADDSGNLYKPDGEAASFASNTYDEAEMEAKTESDYSDMNRLYNVVNSELRMTDYDVWKSELESVFDVDAFLKYLAVNNTIQNWDTYGNMTHNYYLYNNPETNLLTWIPWDNNEAFTNGKGKMSALSFSMSEVRDDWPLISYLMEDETYIEKYQQYLIEFTDQVFNTEKMTQVYEKHYELIKAYAYDEESGYTFIDTDQSFDKAVEYLIQHVEDRKETLDSYLNQ